MNSYSIKKRIYDSPNIWPGFVDILATLIIVIIFILMVFTVSQFYLSDAVVGRDKALAELKVQVRELSKILSTTEQDLDIATKENVELLSQISTSEDIISKRDLAIIELANQVNRLREELAIDEGVKLESYIPSIYKLMLMTE